MTGIQYVNAKQEIFNLLAQVETLLLEATCDGEQIAGTRWGDEIEDALSTLMQAVDYYID
jgi:hypothetical protein